MSDILLDGGFINSADVASTETSGFGVAIMDGREHRLVRSCDRELRFDLRVF
jgi:hypothetical protein